jgi:hypothetical protein
MPPPLTVDELRRDEGWPATESKARRGKSAADMPDTLRDSDADVGS